MLPNRYLVSLGSEVRDTSFYRLPDKFSGLKLDLQGKSGQKVKVHFCADLFSALLRTLPALGNV